MSQTVTLLEHIRAFHGWGTAVALPVLHGTTEMVCGVTPLWTNRMAYECGFPEKNISIGLAFPN